MNRRELLDKQLEEHGLKYKCEHSEAELRRRTLSNGSTQFIKQCLRCGVSVETAVSKNQVAAISNGIEPPPFDAEIIKQWKSEREAEFQAIMGGDKKRADEKRRLFWEWYNEYISSDEWKLKRQKVLQRADYVCEGCREHRAVEVHHLTYAHKGNEFLFELVAVCQECHDKLHDEDFNKDYHVFLRDVIQY